MARKKSALQKITISLLKDGTTTEDAFREFGDVDGYRIDALNSEADSLFTSSSSVRPPKWLKYVEPHVAGTLNNLLVASASAVVLMTAEDRTFALTFGHGRHLLDPEAVVQDFGLRVVLNTVAPEQLKSVDAKTVDDTSVHTQRDVSKGSSFAAFGLDPSRELLRAMTGKPKDETLAHRLTGSDALGVHTRLKLTEIPKLAKRLLKAYEDDAYKENFDFIDYLRPERSAAKIRELQDSLIEMLGNREITDVHLAAPETIDWLDLDGFRISTVDYEDDESENDPSIRSYLDSFDAPAEPTIEDLKKDRVEALSVDSEEMLGRWPIYRCLVFQIERDDQLFVLSAGEWFRVDLDFRKMVEAEVAALPRFAGLPPADAETSEDAYNEKATKILDALCLDRKLVYDGGPDKMEICDVLTRDCRLIHVKQRGSSSTLSHLFTQGVNSAERLFLDGGFREKARAVAAKESAEFANVLPAGAPDTAKIPITFAVITRSKRNTPLTLPFFSVVSLRAAARQLHTYRFPVSVAQVEEPDP
jgi:uncharacterized protein (TIGR04141 family)